MIDRELLTAALENSVIYDRRVAGIPEIGQVKEAAYAQLALLPTACGTCNGVDIAARVSNPCLGCGGSGKVYPAETVARVAAAIRNARVGQQAQGDQLWQLVAVAVLDAINGENS